MIADKFKYIYWLLTWQEKSERSDLQICFNIYFQKFEVGSSLARLHGCSLTRELQHRGTLLGPRPSRVCTFRPRSAWNLPQSGRLVTSPSSHSSRWFVVFCHISHNRIRNEALQEFFLQKNVVNLRCKILQFVAALFRHEKNARKIQVNR